MRLRRPDVPFPQTRDSYEPVDDNVVVPRHVDGLTYTWLEDDTDTPIISVTVDVRFDRHGPACSRMLIEEGSQPLTRKVTSELDPAWFAHDALSIYGFTTSGTNRQVFTPDPSAARDALNALPKRRTVTKARLAEVADAYRRGGAGAVERDCSVSRSQAFRLVNQARDAGLLPPKAEA